MFLIRASLCYPWLISVGHFTQYIFGSRVVFNFFDFRQVFIRALESIVGQLLYDYVPFLQRATTYDAVSKRYCTFGNADVADIVAGPCGIVH